MLKDAVSDKINEISGEFVESCSVTSGYNGSDKNQYRNAYLHELEGGIRWSVKADNIDFTRGKDSLFVTVTRKDKTVEYEVPYEDLSMMFDYLDRDLNMVCQELNKKDVKSASDLTPNQQSYERVKRQVFRKLEDSGFDIEDDEVQNYALGAVELIMYGDGDVNQWWEDTQENYLDDLLDLPRKLDA